MVRNFALTRQAVVGSVIGAFALLLCAVSSTSAASAPTLGMAASFAVLGGSAVTNTGPSVVKGDLGVWPGSAITGFPPGTVLGMTHQTDAVAQQAQTDVTTAYNQLAEQPCTTFLTGQDLGGLTLTPGVYCFTSSAQLTGMLTLDAQGNPGAVFIFKIGSTLTTSSGSSVITINGGSACNIFWQVGSSATLGTTTQFEGNILALTSITLNTGANVSGRTLARNGAVTLDSNQVSNGGCSAATNTPTSTATHPPTSTHVPSPTPTPTITPGGPTLTPIPTATDTPVERDSTNTPVPVVAAATDTPTGIPSGATLTNSTGRALTTPIPPLMLPQTGTGNGPDATGPIVFGLASLAGLATVGLLRRQAGGTKDQL